MEEDVKQKEEETWQHVGAIAEKLVAEMIKKKKEEEKK